MIKLLRLLIPSSKLRNCIKRPIAQTDTGDDKSDGGNDIEASENVGIPT